MIITILLVSFVVSCIILVMAARLVFDAIDPNEEDEDDL